MTTRILLATACMASALSAAAHATNGWARLGPSHTFTTSPVIAFHEGNGILYVHGGGGEEPGSTFAWDGQQ